MLLSKLYDMGVLDITAKVEDIEGKVTVSSLCRRRLAVVMCRIKMCETVSKVMLDFLQPSRKLMKYGYRPRNTSSKVTFELDQTQSQIQLSSSHGKPCEIPCRRA